MDITIDVLKRFGISVQNENYKRFTISENQEYIPCDFFVEGDFSNAAFFLVAGCLR